MERKRLAMYLRSSMEQDINERNKSNIDESDTIANQRDLLMRYAKEKGLEDYKIVEYADDGHTGTNFERPGFQKLIEDAKKGLVDAVIVKDLSRMGRDYIGTGDYIEHFFPQMGIRVISVNDNWDSLEHPGQTPDLDVSFRTILYEMYSRDLSKKRRSSNQVRNKKGIFSANLTPFGYHKSPNNKHLFVPDPEEAAIVKRIFRDFISGKSITDISKSLTSETVLTPSFYNWVNGEYKYSLSDSWTCCTIRKILKDERYTGTMITNRYYQIFGESSMRRNDPSEWYFFPNQHEAIISKEDFDKAQKRFYKSERRSVRKPAKSYPIYCGHCGRHLLKTTYKESSLICNCFEGNPDAVCSNIKIRPDILEKTIMSLIWMQSELLKDYSITIELSKDSLSEIYEKLKKREEESHKWKKQRMRLYSQFQDGHIDQDGFISQKKEILQKEEECLAEIDVLNQQYIEMQSSHESIDSTILSIEDYVKGYEHDIDKINYFVERIEVFNDEHIEIKWRFKDLFADISPKAGTTDVKIKPGIPSQYRKVAIYSQDMYLVAENNHGSVSRETELHYCKKRFNLSEDQISIFHDSRSDNELFFCSGYMRMMAAANKGEIDLIIIRNFSDFYMTKKELKDFLNWTMPRLRCRIISIEDKFDSYCNDQRKLDDQKKRIYAKYKGKRLCDIKLHESILRKAGLKKPMRPKAHHCSFLFGYFHDDNGCYADESVLRYIQKIFKLLSEGRSRIEVCQWLNEEGVITQSKFLRGHGLNAVKEKEPVWTEEKLWMIVRNRRYSNDCRCKELCDSQERPCERRPLVSKEEQEEAIENFKKGGRSKWR